MRYFHDSPSGRDPLAANPPSWDFLLLRVREPGLPLLREARRTAKSFIVFIFWVVFFNAATAQDFSADPLGQTERFNGRLVYCRSHKQTVVALIVRNRCSCRWVKR